MLFPRKLKVVTAKHSSILSPPDPLAETDYFVIVFIMVLSFHGHSLLPCNAPFPGELANLTPSDLRVSERSLFSLKIYSAFSV